MKHILQDLIQIPSVSGEEAEIQDFIHAWLTNLGFEPMWVEQNILVKIKGADSTKAVILNAHVDTVAAGEKDQWQYSPYSGHIDADHKIYGLGASDEKAGVAALLLLAQTLLQQPPACDIWLAFVVREELDGLGTQQTIDWFEQQYRSQYQHLAAILAEPTRLERIEIGHRGNVFIQLEIQGEGGHGSEPEKLHHNSALIMSELLLTLPQLAGQWAQTYVHETLGKPSMAIGTALQAGTLSSPNRLPDKCVATLDIRTTPKLHHQVVALLQTHLKTYPVKITTLFDPAPIGLTNQTDPLVMAACQVCPTAQTGISPGASDHCFYTRVNIPAIVFGPGEPEVIHKPNEWARLDRVDLAPKLYQDIINQWAKMIS